MTRRGPIRAAVVATIALGLLGAGCLPLGWGSGALADELPEGSTDDRGMVVVLGPADVAAGASRLSNLLPSGWSEGAALSGDAALWGGIEVAWEGLTAVPGPVFLRIEGASLVAELGVSFVGDALLLTGAGWPTGCEPRIAADAAELALKTNLSTDKLGRVQAAVSGTGELVLADDAFDWSSCVATETLGLSYLEEALRSRLRDVAVEALAPELLLALPRALGLDVATGVATAMAADELGAGFARLAVRVHEPANQGATMAHGDGIAVAFEVGLAVDPHPCMPAVALPPIGDASSALPGDAVGGSLLLSAAVVERAVAGLWLGGAMCGDHATAGVTVAAGELAHAWPALAELEPTTAIGIEVWPRELPRVGLALDGADRVTIATGLVDVALFAELDGARVRLASIAVDLDVIVGLDASASGAVTLDALDARVRGFGVTRGLFEAPTAATAEALLVPLVDALVEARPLMRLPARAMGNVARRARVSSAHVVFGP